MDSGVLLANAINRARIVIIKNEAKDLVVKTWGEWAWNDFDWIIFRESGWNYKAVNTKSLATGLCQSLPASKMSSEGSDYLDNPLTQIKWCVKYIFRYGNPTNARKFWEKNHWF